MQRMVKQEAESSRVSVRQARRDAVDRAKAVVSKNDKALAERKVGLVCMHCLSLLLAAMLRCLHVCRCRPLQTGIRPRFQRQ